MGIKRILKQLIYGDHTTVLPAGITAVLFCLMLFSSVTITMVFSFLPHLVTSFGIGETERGYYAGLIGSALFAGRALCSFFWGYLADTKGRKFSTILSTALLILTTLVFGFSSTFEWAMVTRCIQGCFMGINVIAKAMMADVCDDTNQALGMSLLMCSYSTGLILGPGIGAFLAFPVDSYPSLFTGSIFAKFQILLPHLVVVCALLVAVCLAVYILPRDRSFRIDEKTKLLTSNKAHVCSPGKKKEIVDVVENEIVKYNPRPCCCACDFKKSRLGNILRRKDCILACFAYASYNTLAVGYDEFFPLYAATSKQYGGYDFNVTQIGTALLIVAMVTVAVEVALFTKLIKTFGAKLVFIFCTLFQSLLLPLHVPLATISNRTMFWMVLLALLILMRICIEGSVVSVAVMLNNSVESNYLGTVNGLSMTISAVGRTFVPTVFGSIYSWSLSNKKSVSMNKNPIGYPFDENFTFLVMTVFGIFNTLLVVQLSSNINKRKTAFTQEKGTTKFCDARTNVTVL